MRRKPMQGGGGQRHHNNNNNQRRHNNNGGGGHYNNNRPRKNYPQLREKYMNQARDALASGDRVMAEYYFQHADHCYRMMVEDGWRPREPRADNAPQDAENSGAAPEAADQAPASAEEVLAENSGALPSFLTMGFTAAAVAQNEQQAAANPPQNWEEN